MATKNGRSVASICAWCYVKIFNAKKIFRPGPLRDDCTHTATVNFWRLSACGALDFIAGGSEKPDTMLRSLSRSFFHTENIPPPAKRNRSKI
nr:hypothetical protein Iba_chr02cCG16480 [Ipomoea batatas]